MKKVSYSAAAILVFSLAASYSWAVQSGGGNVCRNVFAKGKSVHITDLLAQRDLEAARLTEAQILSRNTRTFANLAAYNPTKKNPRAERATELTYADTVALLKAVGNHKTIGLVAQKKYSQPGQEIGYCFGRATYLHLTALKMGLHKDAIRKLWSVGPMKTPDDKIIWQFHVATAVFTSDRGWTVVDTDFAFPVSLDLWRKSQEEMSVDKKLRTFITDPSKMSVDLDRYSRLQMGLDMNRNDDWYRGYFKDMMKSVSTETLAEIGLRKLTKLTPKKEAI